MGSRLQGLERNRVFYTNCELRPPGSNFPSINGVPFADMFRKGITEHFRSELAWLCR